MPKPKPPTTPRIPMTLVPCDGVRVLAGHHAGDLPSDSVLVLEKINATEFILHCVPVSESQQQLRSFLSSDQAELAEITAGIRETTPLPNRSRTRRTTSRTATATQ